jgi:hypothetical protein
MLKRTSKISFSRKLRVSEQKFEKLKKDLPVILGNEAQNHFLDGFRNQGGQTDASKRGWRLWSGEGTHLVDEGVLMGDVQRRATRFGRTVVATSAKTKKYAYKHNRGVEGMRKNEFIGESTELRKKLDELIKLEIKELWQQGR